MKRMVLVLWITLKDLIENMEKESNSDSAETLPNQDYEIGEKSEEQLVFEATQKLLQMRQDEPKDDLKVEENDPKEQDLEEFIRQEQAIEAELRKQMDKWYHWYHDDSVQDLDDDEDVYFDATSEPYEPAIWDSVKDIAKRWCELLYEQMN
ncbi:uncharacterized protein LOC110180380 [Drosophila serrata]|uniref:uncharacterized protein LOC110180380 n=1 Tax=Drosophila serrata TaxID=7274 RepID=UPI000A1D111E|nr:uncharacterized protein LOC110180380 [Drosophila serrata]